MSEQPPTRENPTEEPHHHEEAIDHFEEEFKSLEGVTRFGRPIRIGAAVIIGVAVIALGVWWMSSPPPITSAGRSMTIASGSPIEIVEPRGGTFTEAPGRFAWESVAGRLQYVVRIYVKGTNVPVLERMGTSSTLELSSDERARMKRGNTFVWTVVAQGKDGSTLGAGEATFKIK